MNLIKREQFLSIAVLILTTCGAFAVSTDDLQRLLANPNTFHGKRVTVAGLADIVGAEFWLYPNTRAAKRGDPTVAISWDLSRGPVYKRFDRHWVKVTGIVDAKAHGPLGAAPCEIRAERVDALPSPPLPDPYIYGVFRNETAAAIDLQFASPTGDAFTLNVLPGHVTSPAVIAKGTVSASTRDGKLVAKGDLIPSNAKQYFDRQTRTYYYRVSRGKVELVAASEAGAWKAKR